MRILRRFFLLSLLNLVFVISGQAELELSAKQAILIDLTTDTVLYEKDADALMDPSSMSKIMLIYDVFERLKDGRLTMDDTFTVSKKAWKKGGSKMFVEVGKRVKVGDLLRGIIIQSGNDASIVVAEGLAGTEEAYADYLTERAHEMGATTATFKNATGWPEEGHKMTVKDLALIAKRTIENFPDYYPIYKEVDFTYSGIKQGNRNPLLYEPGLGADGMKTGSSDSGGYGLVGSIVQDGRRLLFVINGCPSVKARAKDARTLAQWGMREFTTITAAKAGQDLGKVEIVDGKQRFMEAKAPENLIVTLPVREAKKTELELNVEQPLKAPVEEGQHIGTIQLKSANGELIKEWPLKSSVSVQELGFVGRLWQKIMRAVLGA